LKISNLYRRTFGRKSFKIPHLTTSPVRWWQF
jgi:hypothetical protein